MPHTTQLFQTWKPEIDGYMQEELDRIKGSKPLYETLFSKETSDRLQLTDTGFSGFNPMVEVGEMGNAVEDRAIEGYTHLYQRRSYRKYATFSSDILETDQTSKVKKMAQDIARVPMYTRNLNIFGMIRNAWNAQYTWGDGKTLINLSHPRKDGGASQANTFLDGVQRALTYDNVITLEDVLLSNVSNSGNLMNFAGESKNKVLWTSYANRERAFQIAGVGGADGKPNTDLNDRNYLRKGNKYDVLVLDFVNYEAAKQAGEVGSISKSSSSNYWDTMWGIADVDVIKENFKVIVAEGYEKFDEEVNKKNQAMIKYAYDKYMYGNSGWFGFAGSKSDGSTLS